MSLCVCVYVCVVLSAFLLILAFRYVRKTGDAGGINCDHFWHLFCFSSACIVESEGVFVVWILMVSPID